MEILPGVTKTAGKAEVLPGQLGRMLLWHSGAESLARVMVEGEDAAIVERLAGSLRPVFGKELR